MSFELIQPHLHDLGSFTVRRSLPALAHRTVGPFIFFDHMGPVELPEGRGMDVRPHPHIGLATVTYLFEGSGLHRDSLGSVQPILPGDINWMLAGRGIVHSERTPPADLKRARRLHGLQTWVALPLDHEDDAPSFSHHPAHTLPAIELPGAVVRLLIGHAFGQSSPVPVYWPIVFAHVTLAAGSSVQLDWGVEQCALYAPEGPIVIDGTPVAAQTMAVMTSRAPPVIACDRATTLVVIGGSALDGERHINWNFVASSRERISAARESWTTYPNGQFPQVPGESEWIPLPAPLPQGVQ
jgi:redox-sensitive bicupin YhaK (pirin superfamily)